MSPSDSRLVESATSTRPGFALAALLDDLRWHPELDLDTLAYHLRQSDATAATGCWHSAVNEARSFLEGLLVDIIAVVRRDPPNKSDGNGTTHRTPFRAYRRSLLQAGFINEDENDVLAYVYGIASAKGCHPGATSEIWCRLVRRMIFTTGQYLIQRYQARKPTTVGRPTITGGSSTVGTPTAAPLSPDKPQPANHKSLWHRCLSALTRPFVQDVI